MDLKKFCLIVVGALMMHQSFVQCAPLDVNAAATIPIEVVRQESSPSDRSFLYELDDGQYREEKIEILSEGTDDEEIVITGKYAFIATDGQTYEVTYKADRNGYFAKTSGPVVQVLTNVAYISPLVLKSLLG